MRLPVGADPDSLPDPAELAELARDLKRAQRARKIFVDDDPWKGLDTTQHRM